MSDGYIVYRQWRSRVRCRVHLLRKARVLEESTDARVAEIGGRIVTLFNILMTAIHAARIDPPAVALSLQDAASTASLK